MRIVGKLVKLNGEFHFIGKTDSGGMIDLIAVLACENQERLDENYMVLLDEDKELYGCKYIKIDEMYILKSIENPEDKERLERIIMKAVALSCESDEFRSECALS